MDTGAMAIVEKPTAAPMACSVPESESTAAHSEPSSVSPVQPLAEEPQTNPLSTNEESSNEDKADDEQGKSAGEGVTEVITTSTDAVITMTAPSPISESQSSGTGARTDPNNLNATQIPVSAPLSSSPASSKPTAAVEQHVKLRSSHSFKRDSGLAVGESPINSTPAAAYTSASAPTPSAPAASASPRNIKRYAPSVVGAASIGGASVAPSVLTAEEELASRRVRSLYDSGSDIQSSYSRRGGGCGADSDTASMVVPGGRAKRLSRGVRNSLVITDEEGGEGGEGGCSPEIGSGALKEEEEGEQSNEVGGQISSEHERGNDSLEVQDEKEAILLAGGMEDWEDIDGKNVDRYGFIIPERRGSGQQGRPSTSASKNDHFRRRRRQMKVLVNPFDNEKAEEMLKSPMVRQQEEMRGKEIERAKKWKAMAISMSGDRKSSRWRRPKSTEKLAEGEGAGVHWKFSTKDPKLISRTWKGIPDCWRATAWHAFLTSSAEKRGNCISDNDLKEIYKELVERGCADDVQIDLDVPRTISSHIMFRRRYRGGQRLLFRVLHALALHFPEVGYVQGMAALAATLLCYYDEETTFIMLVRLWELRGLGKLYEPGFGGLMEALEEFESKWLKGGIVGKHLESLHISPMVYGTRWYLTLFNYSIPFPAQLRVWDVFMLLGDPDPLPPSSSVPPSPRNSQTSSGASIKKRNLGFHFGHNKDKDKPNRPYTARPTTAHTTNTTANTPATANDSSSFNGSLDILHATSAALVDGMKEMLLSADFETAMKLMTRWIPVKDEELLMKVARTEWRTRRKKSAWHHHFDLSRDRESKSDGKSGRGVGLGLRLGKSKESGSVGGPNAGASGLNTSATSPAVSQRHR